MSTNFQHVICTFLMCSFSLVANAQILNYFDADNGGFPQGGNGYTAYNLTVGASNQYCQYGIQSRNNSWGFHSENDQTGIFVKNSSGHAAYLETAQFSTTPATFISSGNDLLSDVQLDGHGRISSVDNLYLKIDTDNSATSSYVILQRNDGISMAAFGEHNQSYIYTKLDVIGDLCYYGSLSSCSDLRYKTNVKPLKNTLANLEKINGVSYDWDHDNWPEKFQDKPQIGFIAQEVEQVYPELVLTDEEGYKKLDYVKMTAVLLEAIKELKEENDVIKQRMNTYEAKVQIQEESTQSVDEN